MRQSCGFLVQWPTLLTLAMFPVARDEAQKQMIQRAQEAKKKLAGAQAVQGPELGASSSSSSSAS